MTVRTDYGDCCPYIVQYTPNTRLTLLVHDISFAPVLRQHMEYVSHNSGEVDKVSKVQQQVSEVKEIMMDNIEKVLDRGEKIELLVDKTENLRVRIVFPKSQDCLLPLCDYLLCTTYITSALFAHTSYEDYERTDTFLLQSQFQADNFHKTGRALRRRMWWQNLKMKLVFASFVVIVILILFLSFCYSNGNDCTKKKED